MPNMYQSWQNRRYIDRGARTRGTQKPANLNDEVQHPKQDPRIPWAQLGDEHLAAHGHKAENAKTKPTTHRVPKLDTLSKT
jgi:hypothetical protein